MHPFGDGDALVDNRSPDFGVSADVNTVEEIRTYDPPLAELLVEIYGEPTWRYTTATTRASTDPHLRTYDPNAAPTFAFPAELDEWYRRTYPHLEKNMSRTREE